MRKGEVVEREELIRILLEFAANPVATDGISSAKPKTLAAKQKLKLVLAGNDVSDPGRALAAIRDAAQSLELNESDKSAHERLTKAILMSAQSSFVGRINNWFDQIMDRTTAEYKFRAQLWTVAGALLVALVVQLDSIELLKRLSADDKLRDSLVKQGENLQQRIDKLPQTPASTPAELNQAKARRDEIESNLATLRDPQLSVLPEHFILCLPTSRARLENNPLKWTLPLPRALEFVAGDKAYPLEPNWTADTLGDIERSVRNSNAPLKTTRETVDGRDDLVFTARNDAVLQLRWQPGNPKTNILDKAAEQSCNDWVCFDRDPLWSSWRGVLLTWILLSLGAPFWYDALKDMLKLRSSLAKKEEDARIDRQTDTTVKTAKEATK